MLQYIRNRLQRAVDRVEARWGRLALQVFRWGFPILLLALLAYSIAQLGWTQVWKARPAELAFYIVLLFPFFVQPVADLAIYRNLLGVGRMLPLTVFLRKRYMNNIMLDYSGEAYFYLWARKNLDLKNGILLHAVKDTNILSAGAGLVMVWLMLLALLAGHVVTVPSFMPTKIWTLVGVGSLPAVFCLALILGGRKVTSLSRTDMAKTFGIHVLRSITALLLEFALWYLSGVLSSAQACMEFVALRLLVTRLPLIPNKELVFVGVGIAAAGLLNASTSGVAAVLVLMTGVSLMQEFAIVGLPWLIEQFQIRRSLDQIAS